jgi:HK97 family phage major capsid protein
MTLVELKAALKSKSEEARKKLTDIAQSCERENRDRTADEVKELETLMRDGRELKAQIDRREGDAALSAEIEKLQSGIVPSSSSPRTGTAPRMELRSMGQQFVESDEYDFFRRGRHRVGSAWRSPSIELVERGMYGLRAETLTTDDGSPPSGGALITPDIRPGIQPILFKRLVIADLLAPGTTESNVVQYMQETYFNNAAAPTAEGAEKQESTLRFEAKTDSVRKIAHWLPVTEEMLEDVAQIRSYIDSRLRLGVQLAEEGQLLNGDGNAPALEGLLARDGLTAAWPQGDDSNADAIFKQMMTIATTAFLMPDGIVINPANWQVIQLSKVDGDTGAYLGGGPFTTPPVKRLWGVAVVDTPTIAAGTALVGAFAQAAQIFRKGGIRVEASNSHADFFIQNLVAIRAEERLALAVYRPTAFGTVTGLD